jgi:excisionase family DNA binding protein
MSLEHSPARGDARETRSRDERLAVPIPEAVRISGISRTRIYEHHKNGRLAFVKDGKKTLIRIAALDALLRQLEAA